ncbi:hydantoinase B/oxoprolinase family protein [Amycolatopsis sp. NBC_01480]|uniref:hydantoinase B/oxoprolinase family protein n=1 Tax=Amycolatopsis sp. NBC_01480 TaxID=2903562 RepID=UPI002E2CE322|nr:hydantoinase B/oxoprolinase family protein [Amycolatopsis sp. NBC_01480]
MTDPITAEIVRNYLDTTADEIYEGLCRSSEHPTVAEGKDCGAGIYSYDGAKAKLAARAGIILHSYAQLSATQTCLDYFHGDLDPGDVLLVADSHWGGSHIGDYTVLVPIFFDGRPRFFTASRLHVADQGGPFPGGANPDAREIWHEGFRPAPLKLMEKGQRRREVWDWLKANNRLPELLEADLNGMLGSCRKGEERVRELCARYGLDTVAEALDWIFEYSERKFRDQVRTWPDGTSVAEVLVDTDNAGTEDIKVRVSVTVAGDDLIIDFAGTDPQTPGSINSVPTNTIAWVCVAMSVLCPEIPVNSGYFNALTIRIPEGSIVGAVPPAATVNSTLCVGGQIGQAVMKACEQFVPRRVGNVSVPLPVHYVLGVDTRGEQGGTTSSGSGKPFFFFDLAFTATSCSGAYGVDGWGGWAGPFSAARPGNCEMTELQYPTLYQRDEYVTDSAAPGQWRGSPSFAFSRTMPGAAGTAAYSDPRGVVYPLPGYAGGYSGTGSVAIFDEGGPAELVVSEAAVFRPFDPEVPVFAHSGAGGGWGDPLDRDPAKVLDDVLDEYVSVEAARADYGVVIDQKHWVVLEEETARERATRRADPNRERVGTGRKQMIERARIQHRIARTEQEATHV